MTKFFILLLFGCCLFLNKSFSQSGYIPGYIVNNNGDTLRGFIKIQSALKNCRQVNFSTDDTQDRNTYRPQDIRSYHISTGESYFSRIVKYRKINTSADRMIEETKKNLNNKYTDYITDTVFLNVLVKGPASLFMYIDSEFHAHYFIQKNNEKLYELYQLKKYAQINVGGYHKDAFRVEKNYIGILKIQFSDCYQVLNEVNKTELTSKSLTKITKSYNNCVALESTPSQNYTAIRNFYIEKSIVIGYNYSKYYFSSSTPYFNYLTKAHPSGSIRFNVGINLNMYDPSLSRKFSLRSGVFYYRIKYDYQYEENPIITLTNSYNVHLENQYIKIPIIVNYDLSDANLRPYLFIGTPCNIVIKSKNILNLVKESQTGSTVYTSGALDPSATQPGVTYTRKYELFGFTLGGGIKHIKEKKFGYSFEVAYENTPSITEIFSLKSRAEDIFIKLGLIF